MSENNNAPVNKGHFNLEPEDRLLNYKKKLSKGWEEGYSEYRKQWNLLPETKEVSEWPLLVDLELASKYNLKCPMCPTVTGEFIEKRVTPFAKGLMDYNLVKKVIDEVAGNIYSLRLSWIGESTLHPKLIDAVKYAKDSGIPEVSFLTNGSKLHLSYMKRLIDAGLDNMTISIDGMDDVYNSIRMPLTFDKTLKKIRTLREYMKANKIDKPLLKIQGIWPAIKENPELYYDTFEPLVDLIAFNPLIDYLHNDDEIEYIDNFYCPQPYQRLVIGASGKVSMCSSDDFQDVEIGDINHESVYKVWHGKRFDAVRKQHQKKDGFLEIKPCKNCYYPRKTEANEKTNIRGREILIENYINRSQNIGS